MGDVACYIRSAISFKSQNYLSSKIENIYFDLLVPKTKPISTVIVYKSPTDNCFLEYLSKGFNDINLMENYLFILVNTNINTLDNDKKILTLVLFLKAMHKFVQL